MGDDPRRLPHGFGPGRCARHAILHNLILSCGVTATLIVAIFAGLINFTLGVLGHEGNPLLVVLSGLRLLRSRPAAA